MSFNPFKEKTKQKAKLKEVCGNCGKIKSNDSDASTTRVVSGSEICTCHLKAANLNSALVPQDPSPDDSLKPTPTKENNIDLGEQYEVLEMIGQGGMGTVYRVRDKTLNKEFAVKVLRDELATDASAIKRFEQEASAASDLTHMSMLAVYGHGRTASGSHYIVMDLLEGESLSQLLKREGQLDAARTINILGQICDALAHAHMKGLVHRDLKPSNIMLVNSGSSADIVKVLDFGIAKLMPASNRETQNLTHTGELFGSPSYMSPEQCLGFSVDARSDIYSLGCMMYEMLAGYPPHAGKNPIQTVAKHLNEEPLPLNNIVPKNKLPKGLEAIVMRCLEKDADQRYQSMDQLALDLKLIASGQAPRQKKKKPQKSFDLLSAPLLAVYITITGLTMSFGPETLQRCVPVLWSSILTMYFWRWLNGKRIDRPSAQEKWKRALVWSFFAAFALSIPLVSVSVFEVKFPFSPEMWSVVNLAMVCLIALAIPIIALGWFVSWILSNNVLKHTHRRALCGLLSFSIPFVLAMFARPQVAYIPFKIAEMLDADRQGKSKLSTLTSVPAACALNMSIILNPEFIEAYSERAARKLAAKDADGINDLTTAIALARVKETYDEVAWYSKLVRALEARKRAQIDSRHYDLALVDLNELIDISRKSPKWNADYYQERGQCYEKLNSYKMALADYSEAIDLGIAGAYTDRARLNAKFHYDNQAISDYSTAIQISPRNRELYARRAAVYMRLGKKSLANSDYRTITSMSDTATNEKSGDVSDMRQWAKDLYYTAVAYQALGDQGSAASLMGLAKNLAKNNGFKASEVEFEPDNDETPRFTQ